MNAWVAKEAGGIPEKELVTIIESARSKVGVPEMTYELAVYRVNRAAFDEKAAADADYSLNTLRGYSKSKAARDGALERLATAIAVTDKKTGEHISLDIRWEENKNHE